MSKKYKPAPNAFFNLIYNRSIYSSKLIFYTYIYLNPNKPGNYNYSYMDYSIHFDHEPFYVGKGVGDRSHCHLSNNNKNNPKANTIRKIQKSKQNFITKSTHFFNIILYK